MVLPLVLLGGREMGPAIGALPVVAVALHGFALVASLIAAPGALLRRRHASLDRLIRTTRRHHVAVLATLSALALAVGKPALLAAAATDRRESWRRPRGCGSSDPRG
jgi:hypothetical protein